VCSAGSAERSPRRGRAATDRHSDILSRLLTTYDVRANLVPDAHLAAIAIGHGLTVYPPDSDFARFSGDVAWRNPLAV
jgi:predicted nucleic acid-binding protein